MKKKPIQIPLFAVLLVCLAILLGALWLRSRGAEEDVSAGWGDNGGGRPSYTLEEINSGVLEDSIIFNTISDSVNGNEKNFVSVCEYDQPGFPGEDRVWNTREITVKNGGIYVIRLYAHNNSTFSDYAAANTRVFFQIPGSSGTEIPVHGFITSDNASPSKYWDGVVFKSDSEFHLEYVYESAYLYNNGIGAGGLNLSDEIVTAQDGVLIGYSGLDGMVPGGYQYANYVTIRVMAVFDSDFRVSQKIRLAGDTEWHNFVDAKVGDELEIQFEYRNTGENTHSDVAVRDVLPSNLEYVAGSTILYTARCPDGVPIDQDELVADGIGIGSYGAGSNAYIRFTVRVVDENLADGVTGLVNWSQACVDGVTLQDFATVRVSKE